MNGSWLFFVKLNAELKIADSLTPCVLAHISSAAFV